MAEGSGYWRKAVRQAASFAGPVVSTLLTIVTALAVFGVVVAFWVPGSSDRPIALPALALAVILLVSLCRGGYVVWQKEVGQPAAQRDMNAAYLGDAQQTIQQLTVQVEEYRLFTSLVSLMADEDVQLGLTLEGPDGESPFVGEQHRYPAHYALLRWQERVTGELRRHGRPDLVKAFYELGQMQLVDHRSQSDVQKAYDAQVELLGRWNEPGR